MPRLHQVEYQVNKVLYWKEKWLGQEQVSANQCKSESELRNILEEFKETIIEYNHDLVCSLLLQSSSHFS